MIEKPDAVEVTDKRGVLALVKEAALQDAMKQPRAEGCGIEKVRSEPPHTHTRTHARTHAQKKKGTKQSGRHTM